MTDTIVPCGPADISVRDRAGARAPRRCSCPGRRLLGRRHAAQRRCRIPTIANRRRNRSDNDLPLGTRGNACLRALTTSSVVTSPWLTAWLDSMVPVGSCDQSSSFEGFRTASTDRTDFDAVHHNPNTSQIPAATKPAPAIREIRRPTGTIFSMSTKAEIVAIHSTFMTPPTNKSIINTQQQPMQ
jgi:hypothetical protein